MTATPHDETATPETAGHDGDDHAHDATETAPRETDENSSAGAHADGGDHGHSSGHDSGRHERAGPLHLLMEGLQISLACAAVGSVVLAGRIYGGEIGRALHVSGVGVTLFAVQRLWHNLHELGLLGTPSALGQQGLFILATLALASGYLFLYQTMHKRVG